MFKVTIQERSLSSGSCMELKSMALPMEQIQVFCGHCQLNRGCPELSTLMPESAGALRRCGRIQPSDFSPSLKALAPLLAVALGSQLLLFRVKVASNRFKSGEKALRLSWGFASSPLPFSYLCRLIRVFGSLVQPLVLSMLHVRSHLFLRRFVALHFVGHDHPWHAALFFLAVYGRSAWLHAGLAAVAAAHPARSP
jgi:hypothetical protein